MEKGLAHWVFVCLFVLMAAPAAYGSSQARGWTGSTVAGLCHSHSNARSEQCLQLTPQFTATPEP